MVGKARRYDAMNRHHLLNPKNHVETEECLVCVLLLRAPSSIGSRRCSCCRRRSPFLPAPRQRGRLIPIIRCASSCRSGRAALPTSPLA